MNDETNIKGIGIEKIAVIMGMALQIAALAWTAAMLYSSVEHNKENLKEINSKLGVELSDIQVRLRAAETEVSILSEIIALERDKRR